MNNLKADPYLTAEELGRKYTIQMFGNSLVEIEDRYAPMDFTGTSLTGNYAVEVKYRPDLKSTAHDEDILEYMKMMNMVNLTPSFKHFYLMLFKDGVARLYHLDKLPITLVRRAVLECPKSSVEDKGITQKEIYNLPIALAKTYTFNV